MSINGIEVYNLSPRNGRKSFYGKAKVLISGNREYLQSYDTIVGYIENRKFHRTWSGYSATTMNHVNSFLMENRIDGGGKAWWDKQPVEQPVRTL